MWKHARIQWLLAIIKRPLLYKILGGMVCVLVIVNIPWQSWLEKLDHQPLNTLVLKGNPAFTRPDDIKDALEKMGGVKGFFGQDVETIKNQIAQLSWIDSLVVHKKWPDRLYFWVRDHIPIAVWNGNDFLSKNGVIFSLPPDKISPKNLPDLTGPNDKAQLLLATWDSMYQQLQRQHLTLKKLALTDRGAWVATLNNGTVLKLGRANWEKKLANFALIYPNIEIPASQKLDYVDLRYPAGAAVKFVDVDISRYEYLE